MKKEIIELQKKKKTNYLSLKGILFYFKDVKLKNGKIKIEIEILFKAFMII